MDQTSWSARSNEVVERFRPTSGSTLGWFGVLLLGVVVVVVLTGGLSLASVRVVLMLLAGMAVVWVTQLRPRARAYADRLVIVNPLRDTSVPLHAIEEVGVQQTLVVFTEHERYVGVGIGRSLRGIMRGEKQAGPGLFGNTKLTQYVDRRDAQLGDRGSMAYPDFVVRRIYHLSDEARTHDVGHDLEVEQRWQWVPILAIVLPLLAFVVTFVG